MSGTFLTFPVILLAKPEADPKARLQRILSDAMHRAGAAADIDTKRVRAYVADHSVTGYVPHDEGHRAIVRGAIVINVDLHNVPSAIRDVVECRNFTAAHEAEYGRGPLVFISSELFWGCHDRDEPSYRDFTVLLGVNSVVGFKRTPVLIRRGMLIARQLGFKSPRVLSAELTKHPELEPLTTRQLRDSLDRLEGRDLLRRCQASRTCTYFSTSLSVDELRAAVKARCQARNAIQSRRELDRQLVMERTKQGPSEGHLKRNSPNVVEKGPLKNEGPSEGQEGTKQGATGGAKTGATKISDPKEVISNKCSERNDGTCAPRGSADEEISDCVAPHPCFCHICAAEKGKKPERRAAP